MTGTAATAVAGAAWHLSAASVTGRAHERSGLPNQDSVAVLLAADGRSVAAAVCDGAGTAPRSQEGAHLTANAMAQSLLALAEHDRLATMDADAVHDWAVAHLERVRQQLRALGEPLSKFHCTFVGCVLAPAGRWLVQIGDSAALVSRAAAGDDGQLCWFPAPTTKVHAGTRGGYANETHFVTDADWSQHLIVAPLSADADAVLLMSDGAMDVALNQGRVFEGFLPIVARALAGTDDRATRDAMLASWLGHPGTYRNTGDDKTLVVALRAATIAGPVAAMPLALAQPPAKPPKPDVTAVPPPPPPPPPPLPPPQDGMLGWWLAVLSMVLALLLMATLAFVVRTQPAKPDPGTQKRPPARQVSAPVSPAAPSLPASQALPQAQPQAPPSEKGRP